MPHQHKSTLNLCILIGNSRLSAVRNSLTCLRGDPTVPVTLIEQSPTRVGRQAARYIEKRYGNPVDVVSGGAIQRFGSQWAAADGEAYYSFLPGGDWLSDQALRRISDFAAANQSDFIYVDQDQVNERGHLDHPRFKPDASYDYFIHTDYIGAFLCVRKSTLSNYDGFDLAQYNLARYRLLLLGFMDGKRIDHLAQPLYHTRLDPDEETANGGRMELLDQHFRSAGEEVQITQTGTNAYRTRRQILDEPKVTIIVPFKDKPGLLHTCLEAVITNTRYSNFEVLGISNRSQSASVYRIMEQFRRRDSRIRFEEHNISFNFSALVNYGVDHAEGNYIVLMNNDVSVVNADWLEALLQHGQRRGIGVVGAKLLYPEGTVQHAGLAIQTSGYIGHLHKYYAAGSCGYMKRLTCVQNVSAVTAALCLFSKRLHRELNGFDEERFKIAFNDVDFCLRAAALGYSNIFTPHAIAYHHESFSRGYESTQTKKSRFEREQKVFAELYQQRMQRGDPYYNPNFDQYRDDFSY